MQTQIELARQGIVSTQMASVARDEELTAEYVRQMVAEGAGKLVAADLRGDKI